MKIFNYVLLLSFLFFINCGEDSEIEDVKSKRVTIITGTISNISYTTCTVNGTINSLGEGVSQHGFCWSESTNPTTNDVKIELGTKSTTGSFTGNLTDLPDDTTLHVRAYAISNGTPVYGKSVSFKTIAYGSGTITTVNISNITKKSASCGGNITDDGGVTITARGVCWSKSKNPTVSDAKTTDGAGKGSFTSKLTNLSCGTTYYVRAYSKNSVGIAYGNQVTFSTSQCTAPIVTTKSITDITNNSAKSGGEVTDNGGNSVTARGVCWSTSKNPTVSDAKTTNGSGKGSYNSSLTNLSSSTTYYVRAYATNSVGTAYGNQVEFTSTTQIYSPPTISVPSTVTGSFTVAISYSSWPTLASNWDCYELEESTVSSTSGFVKIHQSNVTHNSPYNVSLTRAPGTYYYRARVRIGGPLGYSTYSTIATVVVSTPVRSITFVNNSPTNVMLKDIVQIKIARFERDVLTRTDLLTDDPARCLYLPGESISPGKSRKFNITIGSSYSVFIGMGKWEINIVTCTSPYVWYKRTYGTTTTWKNFWIWKVVNVTGHNSGNKILTISGSYMNGNLKVTSGSESLGFNATWYNPIK